MVKRKIIMVDECMRCPHSHKFTGSDTPLILCGLVGRSIPDDVYYSLLIWDQCPLDDAEGFL